MRRQCKVSHFSTLFGTWKGSDTCIFLKCWSFFRICVESAVHFMAGLTCFICTIELSSFSWLIALLVFSIQQTNYFQPIIFRTTNNQYTYKITAVDLQHSLFSKCIKIPQTCCDSQCILIIKRKHFKLPDISVRLCSPNYTYLIYSNCRCWLYWKAAGFSFVRAWQNKSYTKSCMVSDRSSEGRSVLQSCCTKLTFQKSSWKIQISKACGNKVLSERQRKFTSSQSRTQSLLASSCARNTLLWVTAGL